MALKTNIIAPVGGILILAGGLALAFYTATNAPALESARAKAVDKYITMSESALKKGDLKLAEKYAKEALVVDAKNKKAISEFKKVILVSCPATAPQTANSETKAENKTSTMQSAKKPTAPAMQQQSSSDDSDDEMGCI